MSKIKIIVSFILLISLFLGVVSCTPDEESKAESSADVSEDVSEEVSEEESEEEIIEVSGEYEYTSDYKDAMQKYFRVDEPYNNKNNYKFTFLLDGFREYWPYHTENRDTLTLKAVKEDGRELKVVALNLVSPEEYNEAFEKRYPNYVYNYDLYESWMGYRIRSFRILRSYAENILAKFEKVNPIPKENCYSDIDQVFKGVHFIYVPPYHELNMYTLLILAYVDPTEIEQLENLPMVFSVEDVYDGRWFYYDVEWDCWVQMLQ